MHIIAFTQGYGPEEQPTLDAGERFALGKDGVEDLLQQTWHRGEDMGPHFADRGAEVVDGAGCRGPSEAGTQLRTGHTTDR